MGEPNMKLKNIVLLCTVMLSSQAFAGEDGLDRPSFSASRTISIEAQIKAVDHDTREVTLGADDGSEYTFVASEEVRRLDQVHPGDSVVAQIVQNVDVTVHANPKGLKASVGAATEAAVTPDGSAPGAAMAEALVVTAVVEDINLEDQTFTLRGPRGNSMTFEAANPENLKRAKVGDLLVITITEALGIMIKSPGGE
jgi:hypothetical protein